MPKRIHSSSDRQLDLRETEILKSVIRTHVVTGEPVGSKSVSRETRLDLSPATIRAVMADLEERGLLAQPHTSAGRVPTEQGYRLYVDRLMGRPRMSDASAQAIDHALQRSRGEIADLLAEASRQLSLFSSQVGIVLAPAASRIVVERLEFVRLHDRRMVAVLVGRSGVVHNRILETDEPYGQEDLDRVGRYLSEQFSGWTLPEMREELRRRLSEVRGEYDRLISQSLDIGNRAVESQPDDTDVFVEGTSNLLVHPEFADLDRMRSLMRTLEEKARLVDLLSRVMNEPGVQVMIGEEGLDSELSRCSLVASHYLAGERVLGSVGIVGPTRMEYVKAVALVDHLARVLTRLLTRNEGEGAGT